MNVLVVAAHPDDESLGCGGTILRLKKEENANVHIAILGEGATSRNDNCDCANKSLVEKLKNDAQAVAKKLGADLSMHGLPDNKFDCVPLLDIIKTIEKLIAQFEPEIIFTHFYGDLNIDHQIACQAVLTAARPICGSTVKSVYSFEIPSSTDWAFGAFGTQFCPNVFFDITNYIESKLEALSIYQSEMREYPHPRSTDSILAIARRWGGICGVGAAEAFYLLRQVI